MSKKLLAWSAHLYTALGLVCAAGIVLALIRGDDGAFRLAFLLMVIATVIDTTDGWYARRVRVKEVLPGFDGRKLDDLIDFQTYTCLPLLLIWRAELLPTTQQWWLLLPLLASAYGFCQVAAKTDDNYFLGFPSYWNIVAFYLYLLRWPSMWALALIVVLALLTFVPSRYLYTTHGGRFSLMTNLFGIAWAVVLLVLLWQWHAASRALLIVSLSFPLYYRAGAASESIAAAFGTRLSTALAVGTTTVLPTVLDGTTVYVNGVNAPLFFVSPGQVNFQVPVGTLSGPASIVIVARDGSVSQGQIVVGDTSPGIFTRLANGQGAPAAVASTDNGATFTIAMSNPDGSPVEISAGNVIALFGTGLRFKSGEVTATAGGVTGTPSFVGAQGSLVGLDQINLTIPQSMAGKGEMDLVFTVDGKMTNAVRIKVK